MAERTALKPTSPYNWVTTARALELLGKKEEAERARTQATSLRTQEVAV
jgi:hypothetical protein